MVKIVFVFIHFSLFHYSLFTIHSSLFTLHYSLFTIHSSLAKRFHFSLAKRLLVLVAQQVVDCLHRIERREGHLDEDG